MHHQDTKTRTQRSPLIASDEAREGLRPTRRARWPGALHKFFVTRFFFLAPRRRSGERTEERGSRPGDPSSPRSSPPSNGEEGVSLVAAPSRLAWHAVTGRRRGGA